MYALTDADSRRFWLKVQKSDGCWNWSANCNWKGYGQFCLRGATTAAHRIAYELAYGPIPNGLLVCHRCDNPSCVRPGHLFAATQSVNIRDAIAKGRFIPRFVRGESHPVAKLSDADVEIIRASYAAGNVLQRELASQFDVNPGTISRIVNYRRR